MSDSEQITTQEQQPAYTYTPSDNFCIELKKLRKRKKLSQPEFAEALNVSLSSVQNWENGRRVPNDYSCKKIVSTLSLSEKESALLFVIEKNTNASEEEVAFSEVPSEAVVLKPNEAIAAKAHKPKITSKERWENFKEKWRNLNPPFKILIMSVGIWIIFLIGIVLLTLFAYITDDLQENADKNMGYYNRFIVMDWKELMIYCLISLVISVAIATTIYIIKKVGKK